MADIDQAVAHYIAGASTSVVLAFLDALEEAYLHISRLPESGSPAMDNS